MALFPRNHGCIWNPLTWYFHPFFWNWTKKWNSKTYETSDMVSNFSLHNQSCTRFCLVFCKIWGLWKITLTFLFYYGTVLGRNWFLFFRQFHVKLTIKMTVFVTFFGKMLKLWTVSWNCDLANMLKLSDSAGKNWNWRPRRSRVPPVSIFFWPNLTVSICYANITVSWNLSKV